MNRCKKILAVFISLTLLLTCMPGMTLAYAESEESDEISPIVQLDTGCNTSAALLADGSLWMWGENANDQVGISTQGEDVLEPVLVMDDVVYVEVNSTFTRALRNDGSLWEWGRGKKGDSPYPHFEATPRKLLDNVYRFSGDLVMLTDGTLEEIKVSITGYEPNKSCTCSVTKTWELPDAVELVENKGINTVGGKDHGAITSDGKVYTWGIHSHGELGLYPDFAWKDINSSQVPGMFVNEPTQVVIRKGETPKFTKVVMDVYRSAFLSEDGGFYFCGQDGTSGLWYNNVISTPLLVAPGMKDVYIGYNRILVKDNNNRILCYGGLDLNENGCAAEITSSSGVPLTDKYDVVFEDCDLMTISEARNGYMLATKTDGSLWVRGSNSHGQLGFGDTEDRSEWTSGYDVLKAIYGENANIPSGDEGSSESGDITETGRYSGETWGQPLVWGRDTFRFTNNKYSFGQIIEGQPHQFSSLEDIYTAYLISGEDTQPYTYYIGKDRIKALMEKYAADPDSCSGFFYYDCLADRLGQGFSGTDLAAMRNYIKTHGWDGSCYGMSGIAAMYFRGEYSLPLADNFGMADTLYDLMAPYDETTGLIRSNQPLKDELGFWQSVAASVSYEQMQIAFSDKSMQYRLSYLVQELKKGQKAPLLISINWVKDESVLSNDDPADDKKATTAHAVLACALETENGPYVHDGVEYEYRVRTVDPNYLYNGNTDMKKANRYCIYITKDCRHFYLPAYNCYDMSGELDQKGECNLQYVGRVAPLIKSLPKSELKYDTLSSSNNLLKVNDSTITSCSGTFDGIAGRTFVESGDEPLMAVHAEKDLFPEVEVVCPDDQITYYNNGCLAAVAADEGSQMQFENRGVELSNARGEFSIGLTLDEEITGIEENTVVVSGEGAGSIDVQATDETVIIDGQDLNGIRVEAGDKTLVLDETSLPDVDYTLNAVELEIDKNGELACAEHDYSVSSATVVRKTLTYTGKTLHPEIKVLSGDGLRLQEGRDYYMDWPAKSTNVGKYKATIVFMNKYCMSPDRTINYTIVPKAVSSLRLTAQKKGFTAKWAKRTVQTTGYQLQYSTSKSFPKGSRTKLVTIKSNKTLSRKVTRLKARKKYYVRIRTYRRVNGKNYYSAWSKYRTVTTKK